MPEKKSYDLTNRGRSYTLFLTRVFLVGACNPAAMTYPGLVPQSTYRLIAKSLKHNHLRAGTYVEKYGNKKRRQNFFAITGEGINYLSTQTALPWLKHLPSNLSFVRVFPDTHTEAVISFVRGGNTILTALNAGASPTEFLLAGAPIVSFQQREEEDSVEDDVAELEAEWMDGTEFWDRPSAPEREDAIVDGEEAISKSGKSVSLAEIKKSTYYKALAANDITPGGGESREPRLYYFPKRELQERLVMEGAPLNLTYEKFTGVLVNAKRTVTLYHARHDGMTWDSGMETKSVQTVKRFSTQCAPYKSFDTETAAAVILVYGAKNFADIVRNKWRKRTPGTIIGRLYRKVHLVPLSLDGADLLRAILNSDTDTAEASVTQAIQKYGAEQNTDRTRRVFPLLVKGVHVFDGVEMELKSINQALSIVEKEQEKAPFPFAVLCYEWQMPYYYNLFGKVPFYIID